MIDRRTRLGRALAAWRAELVRDLGGPDALSTQQQALVDLVVTEKLVLDSLAVFIAEEVARVGLINRRTRTLMPVVRERVAIADSLTRHLQALGLTRAPAREQTLDEVIRGIEAEKAARALAPGTTKPTLAPRGEQAAIVPASTASSPLAPEPGHRGADAGVSSAAPEHPAYPVSAPEHTEPLEMPGEF